PWTAANVTHPPRNVGWSGSVVTIQEPGYYNVDVMLALASASEGAAVHITRTRGGSTTIVWPPSADPDIWSVDYSTKAFSGTAHAIPCLAGDQLQVLVTAAETVDLSGATLAAYLVDRITQRDTWELVFSAFNFGVTWDGSSWWTTDHRDNVNPALFKRSPSGSILNSYQGFDLIRGGPGARRNRGIVFASDGFIYGVGNDHLQVAKIDPSDGTRSVAFAPVSTNSNSGHFGIGYNGSNLF